MVTRISQFFLFVVIILTTICINTSRVYATCEPHGDGEMCCAGGDENSCHFIPNSSVPDKNRMEGFSVGWNIRLSGGLYGSGFDHDAFGGDFLIGLSLLTLPSATTIGSKEVFFGPACAPILCAIIGLTDMPKSAFGGDEFALSLGVRFSREEGEKVLDVVIRPSVERPCQPASEAPRFSARHSRSLRFDPHQMFGVSPGFPSR